MAVDVRKLKDEASQAFAKGKFPKAVELFDKLIEADPKDLQARMKLGDALVKAGNKQRAVHVYAKVAEAYASEGFLPKAIAACKVILEVDPKHTGTQQVLAGLYAKKLGTDPNAAPRRPATAPAATPPAAPAPSPARPPSEPAPRVELRPQPPAAPMPAAEAELDIELDRGDHGAEGFGTAPAPAAVQHELPPELDTSLYEAKGPEPLAAPPPAPPQNTAPLPVPNVMAPPPAPAPVPAEIDVPLEIDIELSPATAKKLAPPPDDEPLTAPEPPSSSPAQAAPRAAPSLSWGAPSSDSIEAQLESVAAAPSATPLASAPSEVDEAASVEMAFDVPMADSAEEEIEVLSVTAEMPKDLGKALPKIPLFSELTPDAFVALMEQCGFIRAEPGQVILKQGDAGNSFFVVCSGKMRVVKDADGEQIVMAYLPEGAFFGEMALLSGSRRSATVVADEESELLEISAPILNNLVKQYPHVAQSLRQFGRQRLLADVMATSALFRPFDRPERKRLVELFKVREVQAGETIIQESGSADGLYLVMSGELEVQKGQGAKAMSLAKLKEGEIFGEMSLLSHKPATASVIAKRRSTVLRLPRDHFQELIVTYPQVLVLVSELADSRTRANAQAMPVVLAPDSAAPLV